MKKLSLDLETLAVESFETEKHGRSARGTVPAHEHTWICTGQTVCESFCGASQYDCMPSAGASCDRTLCPIEME